MFDLFITNSLLNQLFVCNVLILIYKTILVQVVKVMFACIQVNSNMHLRKESVKIIKISCDYNTLYKKRQ